jgi:formylglycine-generating enzyme required for sulfatase activity
LYSGNVVQRGEDYSCYEDPVIASVAWYCADSGHMTHPVGQKLPNDWGLYDMIGNAEEWVASADLSSYGDGPYVDYGAILDIDSSEQPVLIEARGSGRVGFNSIYRASRAMSYPIYQMEPRRYPGVGLRLVQTLTHSESKVR